jgi:3-dehydroquinate dehydratase-1
LRGAEGQQQRGQRQLGLRHRRAQLAGERRQRGQVQVGGDRLDAEQQRQHQHDEAGRHAGAGGGRRLGNSGGHPYNLRMPTRPLLVHGEPLAGGRVPAVCTPLVARSHEALVAEARELAALAPDLLEWRVDFFDGLADAAAVVRAARAIREAAPGLPLLFTRRSQREGGERIAASEAQVLAAYEAVCGERLAEFVDWEMEGDAQALAAVQRAARDARASVVLSFHDFQQTPPAAEVTRKFARAHALGGDVAKLAVMPRGMHDVLALLEGMLAASESLPIPVIGMSMGPMGALTRACGASFGSALSFAVGRSASAPGQMPIADLRAAIEVLRRAGPGEARA